MTTALSLFHRFQQYLEDGGDPAKWVIDPLKVALNAEVRISAHGLTGWSFLVDQKEETKREANGHPDIYVDYILRAVPSQGDRLLRLRVNPQSYPGELEQGAWLFESQVTFPSPNLELEVQAETAARGEAPFEYLGVSYAPPAEGEGPARYDANVLIIGDTDKDGELEWSDARARSAVCFDFHRDDSGTRQRLWYNQVQGGWSPQGIWIGKPIDLTHVAFSGVHA